MLKDTKKLTWANNVLSQIERNKGKQVAKGWVPTSTCHALLSTRAHGTWASAGAGQTGTAVFGVSTVTKADTMFKSPKWKTTVKRKFLQTHLLKMLKFFPRWHFLTCSCIGTSTPGYRQAKHPNAGSARRLSTRSNNVRKVTSLELSKICDRENLWLGFLI